MPDKFVFVLSGHMLIDWILKSGPEKGVRVIVPPMEGHILSAYAQYNGKTGYHDLAKDAQGSLAGLKFGKSAALEVDEHFCLNDSLIRLDLPVTGFAQIPSLPRPAKIDPLFGRVVDADAFADGTPWGVCLSPKTGSGTKPRCVIRETMAWVYEDVTAAPVLQVGTEKYEAILSDNGGYWWLGLVTTERKPSDVDPRVNRNTHGFPSANDYLEYGQMGLQPKFKFTDELPTKEIITTPGDYETLLDILRKGLSGLSPERSDVRTGSCDLCNYGS